MRTKDALADKGSRYTRASVATSMVVPASRSGYAAVKRVLDWLLSLMALILLFPLFLAGGGGHQAGFQRTGLFRADPDRKKRKAFLYV